jgi:hypothetical protein
MEGTNSGVVSDDALNDRNIDVLSTHHYSPAVQTIPKMMAARDKARNRKPYFVGEFGFIPTADMRRIIDTVISEGISGIMVWSLRSHNRDGGFYYHENAYRWPGFESGKSWDEQAVTQLFREKAYQINGKAPEPVLPPATPRILPIETPYKISWQGSAGASSYLIERKSDEETLAQVVAAKASDADIAYRPLYCDTSARPGRRYTYQIRARNSAGYSDLSEPAGPVTAGDRMLIDELDNGSKWYASSGEPAFVSPRDAARAREDRSRIQGKTGDWIVYRVPGEISGFSADCFATKKDADTAMVFFSGGSADSLRALPVVRQVFEPFRNEYGAYTAVRYTARAPVQGGRFVKIVLGADCQLARIEITYKQ